MKVLFLSAVGDAGELDVCLRVQAAGHVVKWCFRRTEKTKDIGRGLVTIVDDYREWMRWADLVILGDNTKYLRDLDMWRSREGVKIIGASQAAADWELNRTLGQKVFKNAGVGVLPYREFKDYDTAIAYVKKENRRFVSKPCGDEPNKALSYVSKSPEDLVYMLERWKKSSTLKGNFILQDFVPGTEMAVGGWFGPGGFNDGWTENFEFKKLMPGDSGCNTGEMGTVMSVRKKSKLADKVLKPLEDELEKLGYVGYVDVNTIVDDEGNPWPLEWTMRFGWPCFNIQLALSKNPDPASWLMDLAEGVDSHNWKMDEIAVGVVIAIGDFPHSHITRKEVTGVPIYGITPRMEDNIHYCCTMMGAAPQSINDKIITAPMMVTSGDYVLVCTGTGGTVSSAASAAYRVVDKVEMPSSPMFRNDIGRKLSKCLPKIQSQGFASGWQY